MATASLMDSDLQKFEVALDRLGASSAPKKQRPIVDRERVGLSQKEAVAAAATALAALCKKAGRGLAEEVDERFIEQNVGSAPTAFGAQSIGQPVSIRCQQRGCPSRFERATDETPGDSR